MNALVTAGRELTKPLGDRASAVRLRGDGDRASSSASATQITLAWVIRLRWGAALGQAVTVAVTTVILGIDIPAWSLSGITSAPRTI